MHDDGRAEAAGDARGQPAPRAGPVVAAAGPPGAPDGRAAAFIRRARP